MKNELNSWRLYDRLITMHDRKIPKFDINVIFGKQVGNKSINGWNNRWFNAKILLERFEARDGKTK